MGSSHHACTDARRTEARLCSGMKGALDNSLSLPAVLVNMGKLTVTHSQLMRVPHQRLIMLVLWSYTSASRIVRNRVFVCLLVLFISSRVKLTGTNTGEGLSLQTKRQTWEE